MFLAQSFHLCLFGFLVLSVYLQNVEDYEGIIKMSKTSMKAKQLASQLIPRYFKFFPTLSSDAFYAHIDCIDDGELGVCTLCLYTIR